MPSKTPYSHSFMKVMRAGCNWLFLDARADQLSKTDLFFIFQVALLHPPDSVCLFASQKNIADKLCWSHWQVRQSVSRLRKRGWLQTFTTKNDGKAVILNPCLFLFSGEKQIIAKHHSQWNRVKDPTASDIADPWEENEGIPDPAEPVPF